MSRTSNDASDVREGPNTGYLQLSRMMRQGRSWSGHERNCAFLNTRDGRFATVAAASGFDFLDDARAIALADWDLDGDLDVWVSNRNAPRVRFLRNETAPDPAFLALELRGNGTSTNRDAIGARVEVHLRGDAMAPLSRSVRAGEGFLAQSSKSLHFGLGRAREIDRVVVHWPAGVSAEYRGFEPGRRYRITQGDPRPARSSRAGRDLRLVPSVPELPPLAGSARIPLVTRLEMPRLLYRDAAGSPREVAAGRGRPLLIALWASWCRPCIEELQVLTRHEDEVRAAGIDVLALATDGIGGDSTPPAETERALERIDFPFERGWATEETLRGLQYLHDSHLALHRPLPLPLSFLVGATGFLDVIYKGPVPVARLLSDAAGAEAVRRERGQRAGALPGSVIDHEAVERAALLSEAKIRFHFAADMAGGGLLDLAAREYRRAIELVPEFVEARNNLGNIYARQGNLDAAEVEFRRALEARPESADLRYNLGTVFDQRGDFSEAARWYRLAIEAFPDRPEVHNALGLLLAKEGRVREAMAWFRRELDVNPRSAEAHNNIGRALLQEGDAAAALEAFRKALEIAPEHADAHNNVGVLLKRQGRMAEAAAAYRQAIAAQPDFVEAHNNLGLVLLEEGRLELAESCFRRALELDPSFEPARRNLARARNARPGARD